MTQHPETHLVDVVCATCGTAFTFRSTAASVSVEVCSNCHPAYTGVQHSAAGGSRIERFNRRRALAAAWAGVISELQSDGVPVLALANPLRSLPGDAAYIAERVKQIDGPVLLVGHSYGGAVITVAGAEADNVVGLVYVATFIPDEGESLNEINGRFPTSRLGESIRPNTFPVDGNGETGVEVSIAPEDYPTVFAADMPADAAAVAAVSQRPVAVSAFDNKASAAAWKTLPAWAVVATEDQAINPDEERFMAERAGAETVAVDSSHAVMVVEPRAVAAQIRAASQGVTAAVAV